MTAPGLLAYTFPPAIILPRLGQNNCKWVYSIKLSFVLFLFLIHQLPGFSQAIPIVERESSSLIFYQSQPIAPQEFLQKYIRFSSVSGNEKEAAEFLIAVCRESGLIVRKFISDQGDVNFAASVYPLELKKPNLIFLNHMDVISSGDSGLWKYAPFSGEIIDENIHGRGSWDNKGVAVMQLYAIAEFIQASKLKELPFNITFLSVSCEETQCPGGAKFVATHHLKDLNPYAIIGEGPPGIKGIIPSYPGLAIFGISVTQKPVLWLNLEMEIPVSGHGSVTPHEYANQELIIALNKLVHHKEKITFTGENIPLIKNIGKRTNGIKGFILKHPKRFKFLITPELNKHPEMLAMYKNTITITGLSSSSFIPNVIPGKVNCLLDCRLLPFTNETAFLKRLNKILDNKKISIKVITGHPPTPVSGTNHPIYKMLSLAVKEFYGDADVVPVILPNLNDSWHFRAEGVPCFDLIPVILPMKHVKCIHSHDESIPVSALYDGIKVYSVFIDKVMCMAPDSIRGVVSL